MLGFHQGPLSLGPRGKGDEEVCGFVVGSECCGTAVDGHPVAVEFWVEVGEYVGELAVQRALLRG